MPADGSGSTSFVVIRTDWSVLTALRALDATDAHRTILVHHDDRGDQWYLLNTYDIFRELQAHPMEANLASSMPMAEWVPTPIIAPGQGMGDWTQAIVVDGGRAVGFIDWERRAAAAPRNRLSRRTSHPPSRCGAAVGSGRSRRLPRRAMANRSPRTAARTPRRARRSDRSKPSSPRRSWSTPSSGCSSRS